jgi:RHS repeat-associated protein
MKRYLTILIGCLTYILTLSAQGKFEPVPEIPQVPIKEECRFDANPGKTEIEHFIYYGEGVTSNVNECMIYVSHPVNIAFDFHSYSYYKQIGERAPHGVSSLNIRLDQVYSEDGKFLLSHSFQVRVDRETGALTNCQDTFVCLLPGKYLLSFHGINFNSPIFPFAGVTPTSTSYQGAASIASSVIINSHHMIDVTLSAHAVFPDFVQDEDETFQAESGRTETKHFEYFGEDVSCNINRCMVEVSSPVDLTLNFQNYSSFRDNQNVTVETTCFNVLLEQVYSKDNEPLSKDYIEVRFDSIEDLSKQTELFEFLMPGRYLLTVYGFNDELPFQPLLPFGEQDGQVSQEISTTKSTRRIVNPYYRIAVSLSAAAVNVEPSDGEFPMLPEPQPGISEILFPSNRNGVFTFVSTSGNSKTGITTIDYFDDFGRSEESVCVAATPDKKDLVAYQEYDQFGRESRKWLPAKSESGSGEYQPLAVCQASAQATNQDNEPFSYPVYEPTPLNRLSEQYGEGEQWHQNQKRVQLEYLFNGSGELACRLFKVQGDGMDMTITSSGQYAKGKLQVIKSQDEDDHVTFEFKDMQDRTVLSRKVLGDKDYADTYYIYDGIGRLRAIVPPALADKAATGNLSTDLVDKYAYLYSYDNRDRLTLKKLPGADWCHYTYDDNDRLTSSADGEQWSKKERTVYIYDALGRECIQGIVGKDYIGRANKCKYVGAKGRWLGYEPVGLFDQVSITHVNYYDTYSFADDFDLPNRMPLYGSEAPHTRGLLTGTADLRLGADDDPQYDYSLIRYDERNRVVHTEVTNHLGGYDIEDIQLNFLGSPEVRILEHHASGSSVHKETYRYSYDHMNRLLKQTHQLDEGSEVVLSDNQYDDLGRLIEDKRNGLKTIKTDYTYNVRGWLTSIGTPASGSSKFRAFSERLFYNESVEGSTPCWSGNISATEFQCSSSFADTYVYRYDNLSRLTQSLYNPNRQTQPDYSTSYEYDKMGNVTSLQRYGLKYEWGEYGLIDDLTYSYNGNQVVAVTDDATDPTYEGAFHFRDGADADVEYTYDKNGSLTKDLNKDILSIQYNLLHLPLNINFADGKRVAYTYSASGNKIRVCYKESDSSVMKTTDYCGNKIYEDNVLKQIQIDGGYITFGGSTPEYHLYMRDHLGNNRMVVGISKKSSTLDQNNHYYPYGGLLGRNTKGDVQRFKYNGKELDRMNGLDWYDYGARHYDAALGIWRCIDNKAESYPDVSPYVYALNNPVKNIDPDGNSVWTKAAKGAFKLGKIVAKEGFSSLKKGVTYADAFADIIDDYNTLTSSDASRWERVAAGLSLASEALPVSVNDLKDVGKAVGLVEKTAGRTSNAKKTYQTYTKYNPTTRETYVGRTSGTGTPLENVAKRDKNHHKNKEGFGPAKLDKSSDNPDAIRGQEQYRIDQFGGAKSQGGTSGNAINGVSPHNPKAQQYEEARKREFGE